MTGPPAPPGPRLRGVLDRVPTYVPGRRVAAAPGRPAWKLSSNENPYPPLPGVLEAMATEALSLNRYPDATSARLVAALSARFGLPADHFATGTGSVGVLQQAVQISAGAGDEVVHAWRSFEAYPIVVAISGATAVPVPLTPDERHDLDAMAAAITPRTRLVLLCSPNNPTGTALRRAELERFLARVPPEVLVVLDEAYVEFADDPQVADGIELLAGRPNLVVLRTFSKAYGLAGVRVGFAVAHPPVAAALRKTAVPFGVSGVAEAAAVASLAAEPALLERVELLVRERTRVLAELAAQGWPPVAAQGNFVWLRLGDRTPAFATDCDAAGVAVRPFGHEGVRVTVAEPAAGDALLSVARRYAGPA